MSGSRSASSDGSLPPPPKKESPTKTEENVSAQEPKEEAGEADGQIKLDDQVETKEESRGSRGSRSRSWGGSQRGEANPGGTVRRDNRRDIRRGGTDPVETLDITDDDASFILGAGGRTKRKLSRVCGAELNVTDQGGKTVLEIRGSDLARERAKLYVNYVMQQRVGPVKLEFTADERDDLTCIEVPHECVGYVTGRRGHGLRCIEEEWCTLMFFTDLRSNKAGESEKLAIFGAEQRARRGAELKVMSAVEQKLPGHFTKDAGEKGSDETGFDTETTMIREEDYSYALGKEGSTRKKLARASGAILEYVGRVAFIAGTKCQRARAREYLQWLCAQRTSFVHVVTDDRTDCTVVSVPTTCVAYVTGTKGNALRRIEEETGTFIFLDGARGEDAERLLIFGENENGRRRAKSLVEGRIDDKVSGRSRGYGGSGGRRSPYGGRRSPPRGYYRERSRSRGRRWSRSRSRSPRDDYPARGRRASYSGGRDDYSRDDRRDSYGGRPSYRWGGDRHHHGEFGGGGGSSRNYWRSGSAGRSHSPRGRRAY